MPSILCSLHLLRNATPVKQNAVTLFDYLFVLTARISDLELRNDGSAFSFFWAVLCAGFDSLLCISFNFYASTAGPVSKIQSHVNRKSHHIARNNKSEAPNLRFSYHLTLLFSVFPYNPWKHGAATTNQHQFTADIRINGVWVTFASKTAHTTRIDFIIIIIVFARRSCQCHRAVGHAGPITMDFLFRPLSISIYECKKEKSSVWK